MGRVERERWCHYNPSIDPVLKDAEDHEFFALSKMRYTDWSLLRRAARGYSLLELVVVIAVLAILGCFTVARFRTSQVQRSVEQAATEIRALLSLGHSTAVASGSLPVAGMPTTASDGSRILPPVRLVLSNRPLLCQLIDGTHWSDADPAASGQVWKMYTNAAGMVVSIGFAVPQADGALGPRQAVADPVTLVFDSNGSLRINQTNPAALETVPAMPAGATVVISVHAEGVTDHTVDLDSVSGVASLQ